MKPDPLRRRIAAALAASPLLVGAPALAAQAGDVVAWPTVRLLDGRAWGPPQAADKAVLVVFWSTTCPFCLRHNAHIEKLRRAASGRALAILTVARDRDPAAVRAYLSRHGYGFDVTLDAAPLAAALSERRVIPLSVVVDRAGRLREVVPGEMFEEDVMQWLRLA
jgi:thiol-disulfide isomerase/thioredoxin